MAQIVKHLPAMQETRVWSLGREDPLEKEMATHSSTLAWKIPRTEEPCRLQSTESQKVGHNWATSLQSQFQTSHLLISTLFLESQFQTPFSTIGIYNPLILPHLMVSYPFPHLLISLSPWYYGLNCDLSKEMLKS